MHARMVRIYGDLSADVEDPAQDWNDKGERISLLCVNLHCQA